MHTFLLLCAAHALKSRHELKLPLGGAHIQRWQPIVGSDYQLEIRTTGCGRLRWHPGWSRTCYHRPSEVPERGPRYYRGTIKSPLSGHCMRSIDACSSHGQCGVSTHRWNQKDRCPACARACSSCQRQIHQDFLFKYWVDQMVMEMK